MDRNFFALSLGLAGLIVLPTLGRAEPCQCAAHRTVALQPATQLAERALRMRLPLDGTVIELDTSA